MNKKILQYDLNCNFIAEFECTKIASEKLNISRGSIRRCVTGERKSGGGYIFIEKGMDPPVKYIFNLSGNWRDVVGYEDKYKICDDGRVFSMINKFIMIDRDNSNGYRYVGLSMNGKIRNFYIHRLVA